MVKPIRTLLALILAWGLIGELGCNQSGKGQKVVRGAPEQLVSPEQLVKEYAANELKADTAYTGKWIEVVGIVGSVSKTPSTIDLEFNTSTALKVKCSFDKDEFAALLAEVVSNQYVLVLGKCGGKSDAVKLVDCAFYPMGSFTDQVPDAENDKWVYLSGKIDGPTTFSDDGCIVVLGKTPCSCDRPDYERLKSMVGTEVKLLGRFKKGKGLVTARLAQ